MAGRFSYLLSASDAASDGEGCKAEEGGFVRRGPFRYRAGGGEALPRLAVGLAVAYEADADPAPAGMVVFGGDALLLIALLSDCAVYRAAGTPPGRPALRA